MPNLGFHTLEVAAVLQGVRLASKPLGLKASGSNVAHEGTRIARKPYVPGAWPSKLGAHSVTGRHCVQ
jgi:hypothetical protein